MRKKLPTLKDVAGRSGVSTATVRRVLHSNGYVAAATRKAVDTAIEETGYRINAVAQGLRRQRTLTIGHIIHSITPNLFFAGVALGAEREAQAHGCSVLLYNVHGDPERERAGVEALLQRRVDAILFTTALDPANVQRAHDAGIPVVQIERVTPVRTHGVLVDNYIGAVGAMEHLIALGHRRIAFIGAAPARYTRNETISRQPVVEEERLAGYRDTLERHHIAIDEALIALGRYLPPHTSVPVAPEPFGDGHAFTKRLLALPERPTAIFAGSDLLAFGALQALYEVRLHVPGDISVVGFDNTLAPYLAPPLTTVEQPMIAMGETAARIALQGLEAPHREWQPVRTERLTTRLIVRASTGPAPRRS